MTITASYSSIRATRVTIPNGDLQIDAYLAEPAAEGSAGKITNTITTACDRAIQRSPVCRVLPEMLRSRPPRLLLVLHQ